MLIGGPASRRVATMAVTAMLLAACAGNPAPWITDVTTRPAPAGDARGLSNPTPRHTAVPVAGVVSCDVLPQQASTATREEDRLPSLRLPCLTPGPAIDVSALGGRPVLVNLWATWCGPCREEMPLLAATAERYASKVQFLGVNTQDSTDAAAAFLPEVGVTYPQVVDVDGDLLGHLRIPGLPVTVVLDAQGRVVGKHIGQLQPDSLEDLLATVT